MRYKLTPDGRVFDKAVGKHFNPTQSKARNTATELARAGNPELYELIVRPTLNGGSIQFPKESGNSTPRMAGEVFTVPAKESAEITKPTTNVTLLDDLRADSAQHRRTGRHIPKRQAVHTMANNLAAESALSDDPRLGQALMQRYGANHFSSDSLIDFVGDGKLLQRQGVDFITPQKQLIDLKLRRPEATFDDLLTELVSVDTSKQFGTPGSRPSSAQGVIDYISQLKGRDKPGWTVDPSKRTDEIVYFQPGLDKISFINAPALRNAMPELLDRQYQSQRNRPFFSIARNRDYNTVNMPINYSIVRDILGSDIETVRV